MLLLFSDGKVSIATTFVFCRQLGGCIYCRFLLLKQINNISPPKYTEENAAKTVSANNWL